MYENPGKYSLPAHPPCTDAHAYSTGAGLGGASTHFAVLKTRLKRNLDPNMLENALFLKKAGKIAAALGLRRQTLVASSLGILSQTPKLLLPLLIPMT